MRSFRRAEQESSSCILDDLNWPKQVKVELQQSKQDEIFWKVLCQSNMNIT